MNEAITKMKTVPGFYRVSTPDIAKHGMWTVVEVDAEGDAHQMTPNMVRDGVLNDVGWCDDAVVEPHTLEPV